MGFLTNSLASRGASARKRTHRSIRVATAELRDLILDLPCIGAADGIEVGWVRFGAVSKVSSGIGFNGGNRLT